MKHQFTVVAMLVATVVMVPIGLGEDSPSRSTVEPLEPSPAAENPRDLLEAQMKARWSTPVRRTWRIDYRRIDGLANSYRWHIEGTPMWVRIYPTAFKLEALDKSATYEIDATALNQQYGTIDFYVYRLPKVVDRQPGREVTPAK